MDKYIVLKLSKEDSEELGKHFDTAINSMITLLSYMEMKERIPTLNAESAGRSIKRKN